MDDTPSQMPDLQLPVSEYDADAADDYQPLPADEQETEIHFEEKVVQKKISSGSDTFKKRQVKPETKRNVRRRDASP